MKQLIKGGIIADVLNGVFEKKDIIINDGIFKEFLYPNMSCEEEFDEIIDASNLYVLPGLIDAHTHVELSLMSSAPWAEMVIKQGTVATILDPHDVVNVLGCEGAEFLMQEMEMTPLKPVWMAPCCVPSAPGLEDCGYESNFKDVVHMIETMGMKGIAEVMDYNRVIRGESEIMKTLQYAQEKDLMIDGHAPCVVGEDLEKYVLAGVKSDHESITVREQLEKYKSGMYIIIRRGSLKEDASAKELIDMVGDSKRILLSTDGCISIKDMIEKGHMNYAMAQIVSEGVAPMRAIQMATIYPAKAYSLEGMGSISLGNQADFVLVEDLNQFKVRKVYSNGNKIEDDKSYQRLELPERVANSIIRNEISEKELQFSLPIEDGEVTVNILKVIDGTLDTKKEQRRQKVVNGILDLDSDLMYCAVINRYEPKGNIGFGLLSECGVINGAICGSIAQDTQNIIAIGNNTSDLVTSINQVIHKQGGISAVAKGEELQFVPLPVMGIMSQESYEVFDTQLETLEETIRGMGCSLSTPLLTMSLQIPLAVIPELAITNRGLLDVNEGEFIPVIENL